MNILALESSSNYGSIALLDKTKLVFEQFFSEKEFKTEQLTIHLKNILKTSGLSINNIDCFAVSLGPGSYTALRIGLTTLRTISQVTKKPLIGIPTLEIIAAQALPLNGTLIVLTKARQNILNTALFGLNTESFIRLTDDFTIDKETLVYNLSKVKGELYLSGEISQDVINDIKSKNKKTNIKIIPDIFQMPKASTLGYLAYKRSKDTKLKAPIELKINYAFQPHVIMSKKNDPNKRSS